jgi:hypothetical protein
VEEPLNAQEPLKGRNLNECFESFCAEGQSWHDNAGEEAKLKASRVFTDYMILRRAAREENHILALNRVG